MALSDAPLTETAALAPCSARWRHGEGFEMAAAADAVERGARRHERRRVVGRRPAGQPAGSGRAAADPPPPRPPSARRPAGRPIRRLTARLADGCPPSPVGRRHPRLRGRWGSTSAPSPPCSRAGRPPPLARSRRPTGYPRPPPAGRARPHRRLERRRPHAAWRTGDRAAATGRGAHRREHAQPMTEIHFDDRMSDADALMWTIEKDPLLRSTITSVPSSTVPRSRPLPRRAPDAPRMVSPPPATRAVAPDGRSPRTRWEVGSQLRSRLHVRWLRPAAAARVRDVLDLAPGQSPLKFPPW